ncbi:c-type cytochrome [Spirosoma utsteinense]|uniref:Cytochrome c2 n=1 Tax=Spirosoma utsteinense TaxID=2585773 RepID=A0ABR6W0G7_9BACT|nr:cytochrome c [Spirosoma utsteinense]MBC3784665.1 cytochrome c2 [Spirosoma utsteinense]MBC3789581.1 cytochrome c2 [Spirosoma utsteinense]
MLPSVLIRSLTNALTALIALVCLSLLLLVTSSFLYTNQKPILASQEEGAGLPVMPGQAVKMTEQQVHGKQLFENNCAQCHAKTEEVIVGPGLQGVSSRVPNKAWLVTWIRNSQAVVSSGDAYGVALYNKFNKISMSSFPNFTEADISAILAYVDGGSTK